MTDEHSTPHHEVAQPEAGGRDARATEGGAEPREVRVHNVAILAVLLALLAGALLSFSGERAAPRAPFARGKRIAIASCSEGATQAGIEVFEHGGNVVDAAIAVTFAISVTCPESTGLGGGGFFLVHDARTGAIEALDAREVAPVSARADMYRHGHPEDSTDGPRAVAVPGLVAGALDLHKRRGSLPLKTVLAPAIRLARKGFPVGHHLAHASEARAAVLAKDPEAAKIFLHDGKPLVEGELLVQTDLANLLDAIATGSTLSDPPFAKAIAKATNGAVSPEDVIVYEVKHRTPVRGTYRGHEIVSFPPSSSGGPILIEMLNMLETFPLDGLTAGERAHLVVETMRRAYRDRSEYLGDADVVSVPVKGLVSKDAAHEIAATIDRDHATPSYALKPGPAPKHEGDHTIHFTVVDSEGNAVSSTQTINTYFGSCVVAPGIGVLLNNEMDDFSRGPGEANAYGLIQGEANAIGPIKRPLSSMTPTFVFDGKELSLALGSPGGSKIITAVLQVLVNRLDLDLDPREAVAAPRIHHQWLPDQVEAERETDPDVIRELRERGHKVQLVGPGTDVQAVFRDGPGGALMAVSDPRFEGAPAAR
jgi:gamma-glutamyltranspeptidase/glutathione hydrolase